jgi:hypothetical protein
LRQAIGGSVVAVGGFDGGVRPDIPGPMHASKNQFTGYSTEARMILMPDDRIIPGMEEVYLPVIDQAEFGRDEKRSWNNEDNDPGTGRRPGH